MAFRKIAVVRLDRIGDLILTTPAIASIKKRFSESRITAIVSRYNRVVLEGGTDVDEVWEWSWSFGNLLRLAKERFDAVAVFSPTTPSYGLALLSGARLRAGYIYKSRVLTRLFSLVCLNRRVICAVDQKEVQDDDAAIPHEVEQNLEVLTAFEIPSESLEHRLKVPLSREALAWAGESLGSEPHIGLHLSTAWMTGAEPDFPRLVIEMLSKMFPLFVTVGPHEASWARTLALPATVKRFDQVSFLRWAALFHEASVVISTNTGAVHLAASQGVPVVAVFEPEFFAYHRKRWAPWEVPSLILRKDDPDLLQKIIEGANQFAKRKENLGSDLQPQP